MTYPNVVRRLFFLSLTAASAIPAIGCKADDDPSTNAQNEGMGGSSRSDNGDEMSGETEALGATILSLGSLSACALDSDCVPGASCFQGYCGVECTTDEECLDDETCGDRGRCLDEDGNRAADALLSRTRISSITEPVRPVESGVVTGVVVEFDEEVPPQGFLYSSRQRRDRLLAIDRAFADSDDPKTVALPVPENADGTARRVDLLTAAGQVSVVEQQVSPLTGTYGGSLQLAGFGQQGLPFEFELHSEDTVISTASEVWISLAVSESSAFSPTNTDVSSVAQKLTYDEFSEAWVAQFSQPWEMDDDSLFPWMEGRPSSRAIRIELVPIEGGFYGTVKDVWDGFYEERDLLGVLQPESVSLTGDFEVRFVAPLEFAQPTVAQTDIDVPELLPLPPLDACLDAILATATYSDGGETVDCIGSPSIDDFENAPAEEAAECALAVARQALDGDTVSDQVEQYISGGSVGGRSFSDFMDACAMNEDGLCVPSQEVLCARQLTAHALKRQPGDSSQNEALISEYQEATREANLGPQFGAFHADANTRLSWLLSSDFPALVTSSVQAHMDTLLDDWRDDVLEVHMDVMRSYLDESGVAVLGNEVTGDGVEARKRVLTEATQSWRAAMNALTLATRRWDSLLQSEADRTVKAAYASERLRDLYIASLLLIQLNQDAGNGALNATLASGFGAMMGELARLNQPFSRLQFEREGEVSVSHSLNPADGNDDLLNRYQEDARDALDAADVSVGAVIEGAQESALDDALLRAELNEDIAIVRDELIELCGLPSGCSASDFDSVDGECAVRVESGVCGFPEEGAALTSVSVSEAGSALLEVLSATNDHEQARTDFANALQNVRLYEEQTAAYAQAMSDWAVDRRALDEQLSEWAGELTGSRDEAVARIGELTLQQTEGRETAFADYQTGIDEWGSAGTVNTEVFFDDLEVLWARESAANEADVWADVAAESAEYVADIARDFEDIAKNPIAAGLAVAVEGAAITAQAVTSVQAFEAEQRAEFIRIEKERQKELEEGNIETAELEGGLALEEALAAVDSLASEMEQVQSASDAEAALLEELMGNLERDVLYAEQAERDAFELADRQVEYKNRVAQLGALHLRLSQTEMTISQKQLAYAQAVQRAGLLMGRFQEVLSLRDRVDQIVGSPAAVFAWSNKLIGAEEELNRVKGEMMNWLVALEYAAVRPFFDQRLRILLARNTTQLSLIFEELEDLQDNCGGAINEQTVELSVRDDLLAIDVAQEDLLTGEVQSSAERFLALLEGGTIPIDKRVRYSTDGNVGDLVNRGGILATSFNLDIDSFANLKQSCNARVDSLAVKLVGEGLGDTLPTVTLLYDGTSQLRSCQPDIEELVDLVGPETTVFDTVTSFRVAGRSVSPTAGVNEFTNDVNTTLRGLPLVSEYTVLIDKSAGDNADIDWSQLQDIELSLTYSYQDVFAEDHKCGQ